MPDKPTLTREALLNGDIERLVYENRETPKRMSDQQRQELVADTLEYLGPDKSLWVFGYGSLIWNPALHFAEQRRCCINGFERRFCFWTTLSRGTEAFPGLMMGLVSGNECHGLAYRIVRDQAATELDILFRREMPNFVYKPTWVNARCVDSRETFEALTFVVDTQNERFVSDLSREDEVRTLALAEGPLGKNCDYLFSLSQKLQELNFEDPHIRRLSELVREYQRVQGQSR